MRWLLRLVTDQESLTHYSKSQIKQEFVFVLGQDVTDSEFNLLVGALREIHRNYADDPSGFLLYFFEWNSSDESDMEDA